MTFSLFQTTFILEHLIILSLYIVSLCTVFANKNNIAITSIIITLSTAYSLNAIDVIAVIYLGVFVFIGLLFNKNINVATNITSGSALFLGAIALLLHKIPGFNNVLLLDTLQISSNAPTYSLYLNFDKLFLVLALLIILKPKRPSETLTNDGHKAPIALFILVSTLCILLGLSSGLVNVDIKLISAFIPWAIINLFITCFAEELFFRGVIQQQLKRSLQRQKYAVPFSIIATGILFGLAHFSAGIIYCCIATILSIIYGYSYHRTQNIYVPIAMHFSFNVLHFSLLTYPYIRS